MKCGDSGNDGPGTQFRGGGSLAGEEDEGDEDERDGENGLHEIASKGGNEGADGDGSGGGKKEGGELPCKRNRRGRRITGG